MKITRVKFKDGKWYLDAEEGDEGDSTFKRIFMESKDEARPEFAKALYDMGTPALKALGAPKRWLDSFKVSGVSIKHEAERGLGCVVTMQIPMDEISNGPLVLNTPYTVEDAGEGPSMPPALYRALVALLDEAGRYMDGDRAQGDIFAAADDSEGDEE